MNKSFKDQLQSIRNPKTGYPGGLLSRCTNLPAHQANENSINVSSTDAKGLGKRLHKQSIESFTHPLGTFNSMDVFMCVINTPDLPRTYLTGKTPNLSDRINRSHIQRVHVPNYWAIVMEGMWCKILQGKDTANQLVTSLQTPITSFSYKHTKDLAGGKLAVKVVHKDMCRYVGCIILIRQLLTEITEEFGKDGWKLPEAQDTVTNKIVKLVTSVKDNPDTGIYTGLDHLLT